MAREIKATVTNVDGQYILTSYECSFGPQISREPASLPEQMLVGSVAEVARFMGSKSLEIRATLKD